jgi:hypothetical protein
MQFTVTAAMLGLAAAGAIFELVEIDLTQAIGAKKLSLQELLMPVSAISLSALVRPECAILILMLCAMFFLSKLFSVSPRRLFSAMPPYFIVLATVLIWLSINFLGSLFDSSWREFFAFNRLIAQVTDFRRMDNAFWNLPKLAPVGWTLNDVNLLLNWCFADKVWFSKERILAALSVLPPINLKDLVWGRLLGLSRDLNILTTIGVLFCLAPFVDRNRFSSAQAGLLLGCVLSLCAVMIAFLKLDQHILFPILCFLLLVALYHYDLSLYAKNGILSLTAPGLLALILIFAFLNCELPLFKESKERSRLARQFHAGLLALHIQPHSLYFTWGLPIEILPPFANARVYLDGIRILPFGGLSQSPLEAEGLRDFGCDNVSLALLRPGAYLINDDASRLPFLSQFYLERYAKSVGFSEVAMLLPAKKLEVLKCSVK